MKIKVVFLFLVIGLALGLGHVHGHGRGHHLGTCRHVTPDGPEIACFTVFEPGQSPIPQR